MSSQELEEGEINEDSSECPTQMLSLGQADVVGGDGVAQLSQIGTNLMYSGGNLDINFSNSNHNHDENLANLFVPQKNSSLIPILPFMDRDERLENFIGLPQLPGPIFRPNLTVNNNAPSDNISVIRNVLPLHIPPLVRAPPLITHNLVAFSTVTVTPPNVDTSMNDVDLRFENVQSLPHNQLLDRKNKVTSFRIKNPAKLPKPAPVFNSNSPSSKGRSFSFTPFRSTNSRYPRRMSGHKPPVVYREGTAKRKPLPKEQAQARVSIESVDKNASYEDLLEQYKRIRLELSHLRTEEKEQLQKNIPAAAKGRNKPHQKDCRHRRKSKSPRAAVPETKSPSSSRKSKGKSKSLGQTPTVTNKEVKPPKESSPKANKPKPTKESSPKANKPKPTKESSPKANKPKPSKESSPKTIKPKPPKESSPKTIKPKPTKESSPKTNKPKPTKESSPKTNRLEEPLPVPVENIPETENEKDDDEDIMELRRKALESRAQQVAKENREKEEKAALAAAHLALQTNSNQSPSDNYEPVDMDLCSDVPDTQMTDLSEMEMDTEDNESEKDEEDLERLRQQLLKGLESKKTVKVQDSSVETSLDLVQKENLPEVVQNESSSTAKEAETVPEIPGTKDRAPLEETSQRIIVPSKTATNRKDIPPKPKPNANLIVVQPLAKKCQKLVINLQDDSSSSEEESEEETTDQDDSDAVKNGFLLVLDSFLKEVKEKTELPAQLPEAPLQTPVPQLSKAQQNEYRKLKEELNRRDLASTKNKVKLANPSDIIKKNMASEIDNQLKKQREEEAAAAAAAEMKEKQARLSLCEEKLRKERATLTSEGHRVTVLNQVLLRKNHQVKSEELQVKQLKLQLAAAEQNLSTTKKSLQDLQGLVTGIQKSVLNRKSSITVLEKECMTIGKDIKGPSYVVPSTVGKINFRRKSASFSNNTNLKKSVTTNVVKRTQTDFVTERERLQKLEREVAQRLEEIKSKSLGIKPKHTPVLSPVHNTVQINKPKVVATTVVATNSNAIKKITFQPSPPPTSTQNEPPLPSTSQILLSTSTDSDSSQNVTAITKLPPNTVPVDLPILGHSSYKKPQPQQPIASVVPNVDPKMSPVVLIEPLTPEMLQKHGTEIAGSNKRNQKNATFDFSKLRRKRKRSCSNLNDITLRSKNVKRKKVTETETNEVPIENEIIKSSTDFTSNESEIESVKTSMDFPYESCLYHLRSYRLSPHCQIEGYSNRFYSKINPREYICKYDTSGKCNDEGCQYQHITNEHKIWQIELLVDIVSYCPELAGVRKNDSPSVTQAKIAQFCKKIKKTPLKVSGNNQMTKLKQLYTAVLCEISQKLKLEAPYFASKVLARKFIPTYFNKVKNNVMTPMVLDGKNLALEKQNHFWRDIDEATNVQNHDVEKRYFEVDKNDNNIESLEKLVHSEPNNVEVWLKLAKCHMSQTKENNNNRLNKALDTMSRALEANQEDERLWQYYLKLYSLHPDSADDIESMFEQALDYVNSYSIRYRYLEISTSFESKSKICIDIFNHLMVSSSSSEDISVSSAKSHQLLEILFNLVQLQLLAKNSDKALHILKIALNQIDSSEERDKFSDILFKPFLSHLTTRDKVLLWLVYVYFKLFGCLPPLLLEQGTTYLGRFVLKEPFLICWPNDDKIKNESLSLLKCAIENCVVGESEETYNDCIILYSNLSRLQVMLKKERDAISELTKVLDKFPKLEKMWIVLSNCYSMMGLFVEAENALKTGLSHLPKSTRLFETTATFYLQTQRQSEALLLLKNSLRNYLVLDDSIENFDCRFIFQVLLNHFPKDDSTPIVSFKRKPGLNFSDEDKGYLWICYVTILQSQSRPYSEIKEACESALLTVKTVDSKKYVWEHYFQMALAYSSNINEPKKLIHRCFQTLPALIELESDNSVSYNDYAFHNCLIDKLCQKCEALTTQVEILQEFLTAAPNNLQLMKRLVSCLTKLGETSRCFNLLSSFLEVTSGAPELWIIYTTMASEYSTDQEVHRLYSKALGLFPMSVELWQRYIEYEKSQCHQSHVDAAIERFLEGLKLSLPS